MKRLVLIPICFLALAVPVVVLAGGAQGGFDGVVSSIETRYHVHAQRIPFLGLISLISHKATSGGVSGMHVAEIDDFHADVDGDELNSMVEQKLGAGWERVIRETSRKGKEQTLIFMHPEGTADGLVCARSGWQRDGRGAGFGGSESPEREHRQVRSPPSRRLRQEGAGGRRV